MIKRNTLFIIGAAASPDFPLGGKLKGEISKHLQFNFERGAIRISSEQRRLYDAATSLQISNQRLVDIGREIGLGICLDSSIDNFLDKKSDHSDLITCSKLAIADIILKYEAKSSILSSELPRSPSVNDFDGRWYENFSHICFQSCKNKQDIPEAINRFSIISFNYDRCIEQFIRVAAMRLFSISYQEAAELTKELIVVHPYGSLGDLPYSQKTPQVGFGQAHNVPLATIAKNICTFAEQFDDSSLRSTIETLTGKAEFLVFLGFGFHKPNLKILVPPRTSVSRSVIGTSVGMSDYAKAEVSGELSSIFRGWSGNTPLSGANVTLESKECSTFFDDFKLAIAE